MSIDTVYQENRAPEAEIDRQAKRIEDLHELSESKSELLVKNSERIEELEEDNYELSNVMEKLGYYITDEQIDAAVALKDGHNIRTLSEITLWLTLNKLDIKRCEECDGAGMEFVSAANCSMPGPSGVPCPDCNGHGWVKNEESRNDAGDDGGDDRADMGRADVLPAGDGDPHDSDGG